MIPWPTLSVSPQRLFFPGIAGLVMMLAWAGNGWAGRLQALYFYQPDCHWCQRFDAVLRDDRVNRLLAGKVQLTRINLHSSRTDLNVSPASQCPPDPEDGRHKRCLLASHQRTSPGSLAGQLGVTSTPCLIFFAADGDELLRVPGFLPREEFIDVLCNHLPGITGCTPAR